MTHRDPKRLPDTLATRTAGAPKLLRVPDAAEALAISTRTVWRLIATGELTAIKIGRAVRITRASVDAFCGDER
jgi:excisionase family DNA binding protein